MLETSFANFDIHVRLWIRSLFQLPIPQAPILERLTLQRKKEKGKILEAKKDETISFIH